MFKHTNHATNQGFSLVELSILMVILGVVVAGLLGSRTLENESRQVEDTLERMEVISSALDGYFFTNGFYPCPSNRALAETDAALGAATNCLAAASAPGTVDVGSGTDEFQMRLGAVPTRILGLSNEYLVDGWGNRMTFMVTRQLAIDKATYDIYDPLQATNFTQIQDFAGNILYGDESRDVISYILISHGLDGRGTYTRNGTLTLNCGGTRDSENCDLNANKIIVDSPVNDQAVGANFYYDFVVWRRKQAMENKRAGF